MAKAMRETAAALCLTAPFSSVHERAGFIPLPHLILLQRKLSVRNFSRSANGNNLLAVELEKENDATENFFDRLFQSFISVEASAPTTAKRTF
jgi:hypothetical protein